MDIDSRPPINPRLELGLWFGVIAVTTAVLVLLRTTLDESHFALIYLLIVLGATSRVGRRAGLLLAVIGFFAFNFFLLPPYHTFSVADPRDWLVLIAFLITSLVAAQLLYRAQNQASIARDRTIEIEKLSALGAETLSAGRADEAVQAIAKVIQSTLGLSACEIYLAETINDAEFRLAGAAYTDGGAPARDSETSEIFEYVIAHGVVAIERIDGTIHVLDAASEAMGEATWMQRDARAVIIPLDVRERCVGIMRLAHPERLYLDAEQRRFAQALSYYAALGAERARLMRDSERIHALRAADEAKDSFVAAVSHDLRTPLTTIKGLAHELIALDERAAIIEHEADRLDHLVNNVLDLSQLNAGELRVVPELNTADDLVGAAIRQVAGLPRARDLNAVLPEGEVVVGRFDLVQSLRCIVNLIENAFKYSPPNTPVELVISRSNGMIRFAVHDRGPGIAADHVPRIFEPFVRIGQSSQRGAGLGLAIAKRLAAAQHGDITYAPRPGGGSIFTLELPAAVGLSVTS